MIQELKIANFLSFKDEVTFSFEATKDTTFDEYQVVEVDKGVRLLRFALVYGANASGKTNLLYAFNFLFHFWFNKATNVDEPTGAIPFKLDAETPSQPSRLELRFYVNGVRYWYVLELDEKQVYVEKLLYYKSPQPTKLFTRELKGNQSNVTFNSTAVKVSKAAQDEISLKCLPNMSVFAAKNQVNVAIPEIDAAKDWMRRKVMPPVNPSTKMMNFAGQIINNDPRFRQYLLEFVQSADFNITGIDSDIRKIPLGEDYLSFILSRDDISADDKERLQRNPSFDNIETIFEQTVYNSMGKEKYVLPVDVQSYGTIRTIGIEAAIYSAIKTNAFLNIDELETSLHPNLVELIIQRFLLSKGCSQLLVTMHNDSFLNMVDDLISRDSIWFTKKDERGSTDLYSLVEFKGLNRISSFQKAYRNGVFGALPMIKD